MITLFSKVRYLKDQLRASANKIQEVVVSRKSVVRGFVFLIELDGKYYLLVNETDLNVALSQLPKSTIDNVNLSGKLLDLPLVESEDKAMKAQTGVFKWVLAL